MDRKQLILILFSLLLLVLMGIFYFKNDQLNDATDVIESVEQTGLKSEFNSAITDVEKPQNKTIKKKEEPAPKDEIDGVPLTQLLAEISTPVYSDDPVLELVSLSADFRNCKHQFQRMNDQADRRPELKLLVDKINSECQAYATQYPLWFKVHDREKSAIKLPATTILGEQYKHILAGYYGKHSELYFEQLNAARLELSLQIKSPSLVSFGALDSGIGITAPLDKTAFFMDMLHSKVGIWVFRAHEFALQSYSCDLPSSRSCAATSFYMAYKCENDESACGLNFQQWYDSHTTAGMKKDVAILLQYYRDKY